LKMEGKEERIYDPVCGLDLKAGEPREDYSWQGKDFFFCSDFCRGRFSREPEKFLGEPLIRLRELKKEVRLGEHPLEILKGINLHIWPGDFVCLIGASGSGKSTTLNMIGLLDRPSAGKYFLNGQDVFKSSDAERARFRSRLFGFVFQQYNLVPWLTAYENVFLPLIFSRRTALAGKIEQQFADVGLSRVAGQRPFQLSGGEQQRAAILRALVNDPEVIIGDEPTGNLDSATGNRILEMLVRLNRERKKTLIIVTHDADIAEKADQVITIKDGLVVRDHRQHQKIYTEANV